MIIPKKSLGQNFLIDSNVIGKLINSIDINRKNVLEIGPGSGNLTVEILKNNPQNLILIEKDKHLSNFLKEKFNHDKRVEVYNADILSLNIEKFILVV